VKRRELIILGGVSMALPFAVRAQPRMPVIGFLSSASAAGFAFYVAAFRDGLKQDGYFEGWNVAIEYRWAENQAARLPALAADLLARKMGAIFADSRAALAAKAATTTIPIVFSSGGDPIALGLVGGLDKPGGNVTGVTYLVPKVVGKRLQILHALLPKADSIGHLFDSEAPRAESERKEVEEAVRSLGLKLLAVDARAGNFDEAFKTFVRRRVDAIVVGGGARFIGRRDRIVALAARHGLPAIYTLRPWAISGGLLSFGPSIDDANHQCGRYVARVLKGAVPAFLPVIQSTKVELVVNLKTAKTLGLTVPQTLVIAADELIE
jgi:putative tryptophan/tyrosine transport system substrate-binding protein